jgi:hypothetical protein
VCLLTAGLNPPHSFKAAGQKLATFGRESWTLQLSPTSDRAPLGRLERGKESLSGL